MIYFNRLCDYYISNIAYTSREPGCNTGFNLMSDLGTASLPPDTLQLMRENAGNAARLMKALANDSRLLILCYLDGKDLSVSELNENLDLSQSALSQHLAVLRRDGLVKTRRDSQTIYYSLEGDQARRIISTLHDMFCPV